MPATIPMPAPVVPARSSRAVLVAGVLTVLAVLLGANSAYAFLGIADTGDGLLAAIAASSTKQLASIESQLVYIKMQYDKVRTTVGYAEDAYAVADAVRHFNLERFGQKYMDEMINAYPEASYIRRDVLGGGWMNAGGKLAPYMRYCMNNTIKRDGTDITFNGDNVCRQVRTELDTSQQLKMLGLNFGTIPPSMQKTPQGRGAAAVDVEVAAQKAAYLAAVGRAQEYQDKMAQYRKCLEQNQGKTGSSPCEEYARLASFDLVDLQAQTNKLLAEQAQLTALSLEQQNARDKKEMQEAVQRHAAISSGQETFSHKRVTIKVDNDND